MRLLFLLILFCPATLAQSTGALYGRVVDDLGDPLPGANVILQDTQIGTATDIDGNFVMTDIPPGAYVVQVAFVGYQALAEDVQVVAGRFARRNFELIPQEAAYWRMLERTDPGCDPPSLWRPLISLDAFAPRVLAGAEIECLPVAR